MPSRPGCTCPMTDVREMRWPLKHGFHADRAARRWNGATRPGLSCVLHRRIYHVRVLTLGHVLRKKTKHGLSLFLCGACSRTKNGYIYPCQIARIVFTQTTAGIPPAWGDQRGVFTNRARHCHEIRSNQAADDNRRLRALRGPSASIRRTLFGSSGSCRRGRMAVPTFAGHQPALLDAPAHPRHGPAPLRPATAPRRCGHRHLTASTTHGARPPPSRPRRGGRPPRPSAPAPPLPSPPRGVRRPRQWPQRETSTAVDASPAPSTGRRRRQRCLYPRAQRYGRRRARQPASGCTCHRRRDHRRRRRASSRPPLGLNRAPQMHEVLQEGTPAH